MSGLIENKHICLTFETDHQLCAVSAEMLKHIIPHTSIVEYTELPKTPSHIRGVMKAADNLLTLVDLEVLAGNGQSSDETQFVIVLEYNHKLIGVLAHKIHGFISFSDEEISINGNLTNCFMYEGTAYSGINVPALFEYIAP